jgi:hypothetical protein
LEEVLPVSSSCCSVEVLLLVHSLASSCAWDHWDLIHLFLPVVHHHHSSSSSWSVAVAAAAVARRLVALGLRPSSSPSHDHLRVLFPRGTGPRWEAVVVVVAVVVQYHYCVVVVVQLVVDGIALLHGWVPYSSPPKARKCIWSQCPGVL